MKNKTINFLAILLILGLSVAVFSGCSEKASKAMTSVSSTANSNSPLVTDKTQSESTAQTSDESASSSEAQSSSSLTISSEEQASGLSESTLPKEIKPSKPVKSISELPASSQPQPQSKPQSQPQPQPQPDEIKSVQTVKSEDGYNSSEVEQQILILVNQERISLELPPLAWNNSLHASARIRSDEMVSENKLSHVRPNDTKWNTSLDEVSFTDYENANENIAMITNAFISADGTADNKELGKSLFEAWKASPAHYSAIISPDYSNTGISVTRKDGDIFSAEHFSDN